MTAGFSGLIFLVVTSCSLLIAHFSMWCKINLATDKDLLKFDHAVNIIRANTCKMLKCESKAVKHDGKEQNNKNTYGQGLWLICGRIQSAKKILFYWLLHNLSWRWLGTPQGLYWCIHSEGFGRPGRAQPYASVSNSTSSGEKWQKQLPSQTWRLWMMSQEADPCSKLDTITYPTAGGRQHVRMTLYTHELHILVLL